MRHCGVTGQVLKGETPPVQGLQIIKTKRTSNQVFAVSVVRQIQPHPAGLRAPATLIEASDGHVYQVAFPADPEYLNLQFNQAMGAELYSAVGLPVQRWAPLAVTREFIERHQAFWMNGDKAWTPAEGLYFASRFPFSGRQSVWWEVLPASWIELIENRTAFALAWLVDICAQNTSSRRAIFREIEGRYSATFIMRGTMFGGPRGDQDPWMGASLYWDPHIYCGLKRPEIDRNWTRTIRKNVELKFRHVPSQWHTPSAIARLSLCLERLSDPALLDRIWSCMMDCLASGAGASRTESYGQV